MLVEQIVLYREESVLRWEWRLMVDHALRAEGREISFWAARCAAKKAWESLPEWVEVCCAGKTQHYHLCELIHVPSPLGSPPGGAT